MGYQAARLLDQIIQGGKPETHELLIPPRGVVVRESTQAVGIEDERLVRAVRFIEEHVSEDVTVESMCSAASVSRRRLEGLFREELGCTPYRYLIHQQLRIACRLLAERKRRSLNEIAWKSGLRNAKRLYTVLRRELGMTPSEYRRCALNPGLDLPSLPALPRIEEGDAGLTTHDTLQETAS